MSSAQRVLVAMAALTVAGCDSRGRKGEPTGSSVAPTASVVTSATSARAVAVSGRPPSSATPEESVPKTGSSSALPVASAEARRDPALHACCRAHSVYELCNRGPCPRGLRPFYNECMRLLKNKSSLAEAHAELKVAAKKYLPFPMLPACHPNSVKK